MNLEQHIQYIYSAHQTRPREHRNSYRAWDKETPYSVHPVWCAMTILTETTLPSELRNDGAIALLYHDILEDTKAPLPGELSPTVLQYIHDMTYFGDIYEEIEKIWEKDPRIRLFKLYDKVSNILDGAWFTPPIKKMYTDYTMKLTNDVEQHFGPLNIVKIAQALL